MYQMPENIIELNIGGTKFITTTKSTLCSVTNSALATMFSGRHTVTTHKGIIFIDRDGEAFCDMISFLRSGKIPIFESKSRESAFFDELDFWQIPQNLNCGENEENEEMQTFDPNWCAHTLTLDANNRTVRKNDNQHGIVFCTRALDIFNPYIEFKIKIEAVFRGKSHLFVGLVDKAKQKKEHLSKLHTINLIQSLPFGRILLAVCTGMCGTQSLSELTRRVIRLGIFLDTDVSVKRL